MIEHTEQQEQLEKSIKEEEIDLREYWRVIKRHRLSIFGLSFLAALLSALVVFSMKPVYEI